MVKIIFTLTALMFSSFVFGQQSQFAQQFLSEKQEQKVAAYCMENTTFSRDLLQSKGYAIQRRTKNWLFFNASLEELRKSFTQRELNQLYLEYSPPSLLLDTARFVHNVDAVHIGTGLSSSFTGKDVIIGYVDTGIDFRHPDFQHADSSTRVVRYWDQSTDIGGDLSAYGYGIVWDSTDINAGNCTSMDGHSHGSTVAGAGSGNGRAVGRNSGMAPESDIVIVETNFSMPNWTMTVAQACDYIFAVADSMGKPAVVNLSLGSYLGSHDGNDPAAEYMESLLDEKDGRIVISACGNSGNQGKYHCGADVDADTSFVWLHNRSSGGSFGPNTVFFDLWGQMDDSNYDYALKAIDPASNYEVRGSTVFREATSSIGPPIYDTIWNGTNRIATLQIHREQVGENLHFQVLVTQLDSTDYKIGFYTTGSGRYDFWSGQWLGLNNIVQNVPTEVDYPSIIHYNHPDTLQTIVSSWNCSEKVVSVGNVKNQESFPTKAGTTYYPSDTIPHQMLSINSSKGPSRLNIQRPTIVATGDVMLSAAPLWYLNNAANNTRIDTAGWHMTNGGTSMASPVVAGIAALYLERCARGNYQGFIDAVTSTAFENQYTGVLPNHAYGSGLIDAHAILQSNEFSASVAGNTLLCSEPGVASVVLDTGSVSTVEWSTGIVDSATNVYESMSVYGLVFNQHGCGVQSDTLNFVQGEVVNIDPITYDVDDEELYTYSGNSSYQWTLDGADLMDETDSTLQISEPYGTYTCYAISADGCVSETDPFTITLSLEDLKSSKIHVYPNPTLGKISINEEMEIISIQLLDANGKKVNLKKESKGIYNLDALPVGIYHLLIQTKSDNYETKIIRQ